MQVDGFMEMFPSMTYNDVMNLPYRVFKDMHDIRIKRKQREAEEIDRQREQQEKKNAAVAAKSKVVRSR